MNHLSAYEVLQIVDEALANGERSKIVAHLESCHRCRREVELQRMLRGTAGRLPLVKSSEELRDKILSIVAPPPKKKLLQVFLNNLGNVLAMALVLAVVWFAASSTG
ncbi:MAG TPA: zf-HC2 domain-containing protein, partial [Bacteroidota bacterium]|nr:zf-HC2 domain-containing protein [Bacteroidota bacterium]